MPIKKQTTKQVKKTNKRGVAQKEQKIVSFGRAVANFFEKYFQFSGVATRAEYWWAILFLVIVGFVLIMSAMVLQPFNLLLAGFIAMLWVLFCVVIVVPLWAVMSRRLHDAGFSAKLLWISFIFFLYSMLVPKVMPNIVVVDWLSFAWGIIVLILSLFPSKRNNNPYRD